MFTFSRDRDLFLSRELFLSSRDLLRSRDFDLSRDFDRSESLDLFLGLSFDLRSPDRFFRSRDLERRFSQSRDRRRLSPPRGENARFLFLAGDWVGSKLLSDSALNLRFFGKFASPLDGGGIGTGSGALGGLSLYAFPPVVVGGRAGPNRPNFPL